MPEYLQKRNKDSMDLSFLWLGGNYLRSKKNGTLRFLYWALSGHNGQNSWLCFKVFLIYKTNQQIMKYKIVNI
jgi:hypothetical protein